MARIVSNSYNLNWRFSDANGNDYSLANAQALTLWMRMTNPIDELSKKSIGPSYSTIANIVAAKLGDMWYPACDVSSGGYPQANSSTGQLSFSSAANLGAPSSGSDRPFSMSLWFRLSSLAATTIVEKYMTSGYEYGLFSFGGDLEFVLQDKLHGALPSVSIPTSTLVTDTWYHVICSYDGRGGSSAANGMNIYLNGTLQAVTRVNSVSYVGMNPDSSGYLKFGSSMSGLLADIAIWSIALSSSDVKAIYSMSQKVWLKSGFDDNPVRVLLAERDSHSGSYSTVARTGDPDFTGNARTFFDDVKSINFVTDTVLYPKMLQSDSVWIDEGTATPNVMQGLLASGKVVKGVSDTHVSFTPGESLTPYNESRLQFDTTTGTAFLTGTSNNLLPGFDQRLGSKLSLPFDLSNTQESLVMMLTGTTANSSGYTHGVNSGIAYYNWSQKKWDIVGVGPINTSGSAVDYLRGYPWLTGTLLAVANSQNFDTPSPSPPEFKSYNVFADIGVPVPTAGFPFASKFDPTSEQKLCLSATIRQPVLVEKVSLHVSAALGTYPVTVGNFGVSNATFVLLKNKQIGAFKRTNSVFYEGQSVSSGYLLSQSIDTYDVTSQRDIIWFSRVGQYDKSAFASESTFQAVSASAHASCDSWYPANSLNHNYTGTISFSTEAKMPSGSPFGNEIKRIPYDIVHNDGYRYFSFVPEGVSRDLVSFSSGRSFIRNVAGSQKINSFIAANTSYRYLDNAGSVIPYSVYASSSVDSPYVVTPADELILACIFQPSTIRYDRLGSELSPLKLLPGEGGITLHGTCITNGMSAYPQTNQPLTTNAIHEDLHEDLSDQFDVETYQSLSGTYVDLVITGSMLATPIGDPTAANVRKVQASVAAGQGGTTGSLQRFVKLQSSEELVYDDRASTTAKFRRDRTGQFRDMFEQRQFPTNIVNTSIEYPVSVQFFSRPGKSGKNSQVTDASKTHSQNLSPYCTSSLPYFDGVAVERSDDPDVTLTSVELTGLTGI